MLGGAVRAQLEELDLDVGELNLQSDVAGGSSRYGRAWGNNDSGPPGKADRKPERQRVKAAGSASPAVGS
jgi:hypothetical protein